MMDGNIAVDQDVKLFHIQKIIGRATATADLDTALIYLLDLLRDPHLQMVMVLGLLTLTEARLLSPEFIILQATHLLLG